MNGPRHFREAELLLADAAGEIDQTAQQSRLTALVHATLAVAAATADAAPSTVVREAWAEVTG